MAHFQLVNLFVVVVLIRYSYEFNMRNSGLEDSIRGAALDQSEKVLLDKVFSDQKQLEARTKELIRKDEDEVKTISENIRLAANRMAEGGAGDASNVEHWKSIQDELRKGINVIIEAYQRFIDVHQKVCGSIEDYAKGMIEKYKDELSAIDEMPVPASQDDSPPIQNSETSELIDKFLRILNYARAHQETLRTATDCTADLTQSALTHHARIINPPETVTHTIHIRITHPTAVEYDNPKISLPCNDVENYNGHQSCSNAIVATTRALASSIRGATK